MLFKRLRTPHLQGSQLVLEEKDFLEKVKRRILEKEGIPAEQQRLIFANPVSSVSSTESEVRGTVEELLGELDKWQAVVFCNNKAIGKFILPRLHSIETVTENFLGEGHKLHRAVEVEVVELAYERWTPAWVKGKGPESIKSVYIPVDSRFKESTYRIQVIGKIKGSSFAVPFAYAFSGRDTAASLSLSLQRSDYIRGHQQRRAEVGDQQSAVSFQSDEVTIECGAGLQGFGAVFDIADQPSWLKCIILRFALVANNFLDEQSTKEAPEQASQVMCSSSSSKLETEITQEVAGPMAAPAGSATDLPSPAIGRPAGASEVIPGVSADVGPEHRPKAKKKKKGQKAKQASKPRVDIQEGPGVLEEEGVAAIEVAEAGEFLPVPVAAGFGTDAPNVNGTEALGGAQARTRSRGGGAGGNEKGARKTSGGSRDPDGSGSEDDFGNDATGAGGGKAPGGSGQGGDDGDQGNRGRKNLRANGRAEEGKLKQKKAPHENGEKGRLDREGSGVSSEGTPHGEAHSIQQPVREDSLRPSRAYAAGPVEPPPETRPPRLQKEAISSYRNGYTQPPELSHRSRQHERNSRQGPLVPPSRLGSGSWSSSKTQWPLVEEAEGVPSGVRRRPVEEPVLSNSLDSTSGMAGSHVAPPPGFGGLEMSRDFEPSFPRGKSLGSPPGFEGLRATNPRSIVFSGDRVAGPPPGFNESGGAEPMPRQQFPNRDVRHSAGQHAEPVAAGRRGSSPAGVRASSGPSYIAAEPSHIVPAASAAPRSSLFDGLEPVPRVKAEANGPVAHSGLPVPVGVRHLAIQNGGIPSEHHAVVPVGRMKASKPHRRSHLASEGAGAGPLPAQLPPVAVVAAPLRGAGAGLERLSSVSPDAVTSPAAGSDPSFMDHMRQSTTPDLVVVPTPVTSPHIVPDNGLFYSEDRPSPVPHISLGASAPGLPEALPLVPTGRSAQHAPAGLELQPLRPLVDGVHNEDSDEVSQLPWVQGMNTYQKTQHQLYYQRLAEQQKAKLAGLARQAPAGDAGLLRPMVERPLASWEPGLLPRTGCGRTELESAGNGLLDKTPSSFILERSRGLLGSVGIPLGDSPTARSTCSEDGGGEETDLDRFIVHTTPLLPCLVNSSPVSRNRLHMTDVWEWFREPSVFGQEVEVLGGPRGPSRAFFAPQLSAIQLFAAAALPPSYAAPNPSVKLYRCRDAHWAVAGRSDVVRPVLEYFETVNPFQRKPLYDKVMELGAQGNPAVRRALFEDSLTAVHPASWFAVAWYPIYRIPDAPLSARFLTYHTLTLPTAPSSFEGPVHAGTAKISLPLVGLRWENRMGEPWLEVLPSGTEAWAPHSAAAAHAAADGGGGPIRLRLRGLAAAAERFSRGLGFEMAVGGGHVLQPAHQDFMFFKERGVL